MWWTESDVWPVRESRVSQRLDTRRSEVLTDTVGGYKNGARAARHTTPGRGSRCIRGIGRRTAKCPAGRLRLLRLGGDMKSWVRLLLLAVLSVAGLQLGNAEVRPDDLRYGTIRGGRGSRKCAGSDGSVETGINVESSDVPGREMSK